ncbi:MAG: MBL fold metallo-hydrolase, partial [Gammaproteobacteria bacterium]
PYLMRCALIGSGSAGNASLVSGGETSVLVDCGYSIREFEARADALSFDPRCLTAILVTHEHEDHASGVAALARKYQIPVYCTRGTRVATETREGPLDDWHQISPHAAFQLGEFEVHPVPVPHDAREPSQFILSHRDRRLGILTDLGSITPHVVSHYRSVDALVLEFNHDPALLAESAYPAQLKRRIAGNYGHFSNSQAQSLLAAIGASRLQHIIAAHLSERTNHPDIVARCLEESMQDHGNIVWSIAAQGNVLPWFDI